MYNNALNKFSANYQIRWNQSLNLLCLPSKWSYIDCMSSILTDEGDLKVIVSHLSWLIMPSANSAISSMIRLRVFVDKTMANWVCYYCTFLMYALQTSKTNNKGARLELSSLLRHPYFSMSESCHHQNDFSAHVFLCSHDIAVLSADQSGYVCVYPCITIIPIHPVSVYVLMT